MKAVLATLSFVSSVLLALVALNSSQRARPFLLIPIVLLGAYSFTGVNDVARSLEQANLFGMFILIYLSHIGCALMVEKHTLPTKGWRSAYKMVFNGRWIGTARQAPDVHPREVSSSESLFSKHLFGSWLKDHRTRFLIDRATSALTIYLIDYAYNHTVVAAHPTWYQPLQYADFIPTKQTYLRRIADVTVRETIIRTGLVSYFVWHAFAYYTLLHDLLAFGFVLLHVDQPEDWPPLYGSLADAWTLRRFWGKFWHRLVHRSYTGYGILLANGLGLPRGIFSKLFVNFFVFFMSGAVHAIMTWQMGFSCGYWEDVSWFCLNFAVVVLEELVQNICRWCKIRLPAPVSKTLGYAWVFGFFFWSLPKTQYPKVLCTPH